MRWYEGLTPLDIDVSLQARQFLEMFWDLDDTTARQPITDETFQVPEGGLWALLHAVGGDPTKVANLSITSGAGGTGTPYTVRLSPPESEFQVQALPFKGRLRFHASAVGNTVYATYQASHSSLTMADFARVWNAVVAAQGDVTALQSDVTTLQSDVTTLQSDVSGLQSDVSGLQSDVTTLQSDVTTLQSDVSGLQSDVTTLQSDVTTLQSDVTTLQSDVAALGASSTALTGVCGENLSACFARFDPTDGKLYKPDVTDRDKLATVWVAGTYTTGQTATAVAVGKFTPGATMLVNRDVYVGRNGKPTWYVDDDSFEATNGLVTGDWVQHAGKAVSASVFVCSGLGPAINQVP
ncbi:MAG: hypothetical protein GHCLOJNM_01565 [bacterium]|nr:hypothetical protein [bacterium]